MGAAFVAGRRSGWTRPRVALLSNGEEPTKGTDDVVAAHEQLAARAPTVADLEFVGNVEGTQVTTGAADVIVTDGFTGNVALKLMEGTSATLLGAVRDGGHLDAARRSSAGCCCARRCGGCATRSTRRRRAAPTCSGCAASGSWRTGASRAAGSRRRSAWPRAACASDVVERTHELLESAGRAALRAGVRARR